MSRPIGFLPSITETNSSDNEDDPPLYCPPYPVDDESFRKGPPPYPVEPVAPGIGFSPQNMPFPMSSEDSNCAVPSTLTISNVHHKIGLTPTEREEIVEVLLQMKRTAEGQTEIKRKEFWNAQKKLTELMYNAQPRMTDTDRDEFVNVAKGMKQIRNQQDQIRIKEQGIEYFRNQQGHIRIKEEGIDIISAHRLQRLARQKQINELEDSIDNCYCDFWSILFKLLQLIMIILAFAEYNQWVANILNVNYKNTPTLLFTMLNSFTIITTIILLTFYITGQVPSLIMYKIECVYCVICMVAYYCATFFQSWRSFNVPLFGLGAMFAYALDIIRIYCRVKNTINSPNNSHSTIPPLNKQNVKNSPQDHPVNQSAKNFTGDNLFIPDNTGCHCNGSYHPSCSNLINTSDNNYHGQRYAILQTVHVE